MIAVSIHLLEHEISQKFMLNLQITLDDVASIAEKKLFCLNPPPAVNYIHNL